MSVSVVQDKIQPTLAFLLEEWLGVAELLGRPRFADHDLDGVRDFLGAAASIAARHFESANRVIDTEEPRFDAGEVILPEVTRKAVDAYREFGFAAAVADHEYGGLQLPRTVDAAAKITFAAASVGLNPALLTEANASLLLTYGTPAQREVFAVRELAGTWSGTMCLSEPQAGSSLSDITTRAVPDGDGHAADLLGPRYRVFGSKMWISAGEHQLTENIVHLVLAKVPDENGQMPPGTRGISLFIVPKFVVTESGELHERNDVALVGLNHKLGWRGTPNTALVFGDGSRQPRGEAGAIGYLVGEVGRGLPQMFHMMNAARIEIGLSAAALGIAGYAVSLDYARSRPQGRHPEPGGKSAARPQVTIVEHADVRRMLLAQKAYAEGGVALALYAARLLDEQETGQDSAEAGMLLDLLTPIVKSWPSEWCLEANSLAIQVMGGAGYTREYPVEQYWRDNRLNMIHEGTHGIQGLDLLGRKVVQDSGRALDALEVRIAGTVRAAIAAGFVDQAGALEHAWAATREAAVSAWSAGDPREATANATLFLQGCGHVVMAWLWLDIAVAAERSTHAEAAGKVAAMHYFFAYELPKAAVWLDVVRAGGRQLLDLDPAVL